MRRMVFGYAAVFFCVIATASNAQEKLQPKKSVYCGVGLNIGFQRTDPEINREFRDRSDSVTSAYYGGTLAIGYNHTVSDRCFVGIEAGVDFGELAKSARIGGVLAAKSYAMGSEIQKREILHNMMSEIAAEMHECTWVGGGVASHAVINGSWENLVRVIRYIGGNGDDIRSDFVTGPAHAEGAFLNPTRGNPNATLRNFMGRTMDRIRVLGGGDELEGLRQIREFVVTRYPNYANVLRHVAEQDLGATVNSRVPGGGADLDGASALDISNFLNNIRMDAFDFEDIGVNDANVCALADLQSEMNSLYHPTSADDTVFAYPYGRGEISNEVKSKTNFDVCPHISVKAGYYYKELKTSLYVKAGLIQLNGRITPVSDWWSLRDEKFKKIAPFFGVGFIRNIDRHWSMMGEITQTLKVTKNLSEIRVFGYTIKNRAKIKRTNARFMFTYSF